MTLTPAQRKERMPHGGQTRAARRSKTSETYITNVMNGLVQPKTPRGARTLARAQRELAREMGVDVKEAFGTATAEQPKAQVA